MPDTSSHPAAATHWQIAPDRRLDLDAGPLLVGILNVTPDSFSDGGCHDAPAAAIDHGLAMAEAGAAIIDIGGESTRPGADRINADEQIARVLPVIRGLLNRRDGLVISIDTTLGDVAEAALDAGAMIINDVSAGEEDPKLLELAASRGCGLVLMHRLRAPGDDSFSDQYDPDDRPDYDDVVDEVVNYLQRRAGAAIDAGVSPESIALDPGFGFGKTVAQNVDLLRRIDEVVALGYPVFAGVSRKSFIGAVTGEEDPTRRDPGSVAMALRLAASGTHLIRVHDVQSHTQALRVWAAAD